MAQTAQLVAALKLALKRHGFSYADVAKHLELSEASVKRTFAQSAFSLERLDAICQMMAIEISDLVAEMNQQSTANLLSQLTEAQEQELVADPVLLLVAVCVLNGWSLTDLTERYRLTEAQCIHHLATLDRMKLISLLPMNRIKLLVATNFTWRQNGPIQRFFQSTLATDFFDGQFERHDEQLIVINGMLSEGAMAVFLRKLRLLAQEFEDLNQQDKALPLSQRNGITVVLAAKHWQFGLFDHLRK